MPASRGLKASRHLKPPVINSDTKLNEAYIYPITSIEPATIIVNGVIP
jgi:hypothetical protein